MPPHKKIRFYNKLSFKISSIIILIILLGIGLTIYFYTEAQNRALVQSRIEAIREESEVLHIAIRNNMLAGEAPIAVQLFKDFSRSEFISDVKLYRPDGVAAFSDNQTVDVVNKIIGINRFMKKSSFVTEAPISDSDFESSVNQVSDVYIEETTGDDKKITIYTPLINRPRCAQCHGLDHVIRGVISISSPLNKVYKETMRNTIVSSSMALGVIIFLSLTISFFLNRSVIKKILHIGVVAQRVGEGDFRQKIQFESRDEIGELAQRINEMITGLNERFKLSKFVSKSTMDHVQKTDEISLGGERKPITVLFSDIRGFTSYSENHDPESVMETLNIVMNLQSDIIHAHNGDIDKYVGDEIMAVFEGEDMVENACKAAIDIRNSMNNRLKKGDIDVAVGIGINTGSVVVGNMGSKDRIDRTVIGDAVNLGARLCSVAGKNVIVISQFTFDVLKDQLVVKEHEPIKVKGKKDPIIIYTLREFK